MKASTLACKSSTLLKEPRLSSLRTRMESQISSLFHPGSMIGGVMKDHFVGRIAQKGRSTRHQGQDAVLAFLAQVLFDARYLGDPADERLGLMDVEVVTHKVPARGRRISGHHGLHMS